MRIHPLFFGLALVTCTDDPEDPNPSGSGELGVGTFTYLCRSEGDFTCGIGQTTAAFPANFALGGRFGLSYAWKSEVDHINDPLPALQTAAPEQLSYGGDTFTALAAGYSAVLAVTGNSEVVDLIHAPVRAIDDLRLVDAATLPNLAPLSDLVVALHDSPQLQLVPLDLNDSPLSGALEATWTSSDAAVVHVMAGDGTGRVRLEASAQGEATLTATLGDRQVSLTITVDPSLQPTTGPDETTDATGETTTLSTGETTDGSTGDATDTTTTDTTTSDTTTDTTGGAL